MKRLDKNKNKEILNRDSKKKLINKIKNNNKNSNNNKKEKNNQNDH